MQNAGLALGIIAVQFNSDLGMVVIASLWGIWHIVSGMGLALLWRRSDRLHGQGVQHA
jgi:BASS family bile acid:Na+ symporter